jgi:hypothetical protein
MTIFVYLRSGLPERQDSKMSSVTGEGIGSAYFSAYVRLHCTVSGNKSCPAATADEAGSDAIPNVAGGEGGHGTATPDVATHRYSGSHFFIFVTIPISCQPLPDAQAYAGVSCCRLSLCKNDG